MLLPPPYHHHHHPGLRRIMVLGQPLRHDPSTFDWYQKYPPSPSPPPLHSSTPTTQFSSSAVAIPATFSEGMVDDGYDEVVNIDISSVVIEAMQKKYVNRPQLKYMKMDVRDMRAFDTRSFAAVIDKGTLDSLLCGHNSRQNAGKMLEEVWRVLKDKGVYILITYGSPAYRLPLLKDLSWTIKLHVIEKLASGNSSHQTTDVTCPIPLDVNGGSAEAAAGMKADVHYIYVCIKPPLCQDNSERVKDESPMEG
ncbi:eEF1A lysine and N-terminal methyltransferase [Sesamum angolense]|uniref:EEF1A lysine and N-terminal methyltransferase n=1 Tax=Sesamum angolense TaxID=2727404 RepID=A0AAE2C1C7_9LAMI|nr:eEF1A lysine and N-terminal methyltransferase [Sesamum angolense]